MLLEDDQDDVQYNEQPRVAPRNKGVKNKVLVRVTRSLVAARRGVNRRIYIIIYG